MARAKRTHRAEARRRSRELRAAEGSVASDGAPSSTLVTASPTGEVPAARDQGGILPRISRPDIAGDLRALPSLVLSRRFVIPVLLMVAGLAIYLVAWGGGPAAAEQNQLLALVANMAIGSPGQVYVPALSVFLGGYLAPRAGYLVGLLLGLINAVLSLILMRSLSLNPAWDVPIPQVTPAVSYRVLFESVLAPGPLLGYVGQAALWGIAVGAIASWYRRFLQRSAERRRAQLIERQRQRQVRERERAQDERRKAVEERRKGRSTTSGTTAGSGGQTQGR